jgi:hypothetical protein
MPLRTRLSHLIVLALVALSPLRAADLDGSPVAVGNAEAERLYKYANDYVANVVEGRYSYAYIQFYWKRAESFIERAERVYPDSPTGRALISGQLKVGPYDLGYFKNRVLARLEEKRSYAVDAVSCANFLYELDKKRQDSIHDAAYASIIEVLARQDRWGEAFAFPTLPEKRPLLFGVLFRVAARSPNDEHAVIDDLIEHSAPAMQTQAGYMPSLAEAYVLLGKPRSEIADFVTKHPQDEVKIAVLRGMVEREVQIRRQTELRIGVKDEIDTAHYTLLNLDVRDDVMGAARQLFPTGIPQEALNLLAQYRAGLGERPDAGAPTEVHLAYLEYLGAFEKFDELEAYIQAPGLSPSDRKACELKAIEMFAQGGRMDDAERYRADYVASDTSAADEAEYSEFEGQISSIDVAYTVREKTFSSMSFKDPCVLSRAIMEWSLTPNRSIRGAGPWDSVILKYEAGFDNLPAPKSNAVRDAASAINPY